MIAIDTNVLLRYLLDDDKVQSGKASSLMARHDLVFVSHVVLVETVWTLTGKKYRLDAQAVADVILALFEEPNIVFEDTDVVWHALADFRQANDCPQSAKREPFGFPDALILNVAKFTAPLFDEPFEGLYTFDAALQQLDGVRKP